MSKEQQGQRPALGPDATFVSEELAASLLPQRDFGAHKWGVGGVVIVAGAPGYVGAPALCAMAAGRAGAGIVNLAVPRSIIPAVASHVTEASYLLLPEGDSIGAGRRAAEVISERLERAHAIVIGPGLGTDLEAEQLLSALFGLHRDKSSAIGFSATRSSQAKATSAGEAHGIAAAGKPILIDADGLNWLAKQENWWNALPPGIAVLTPHPGEFGRLLDVSPKELLEDPLTAVKVAAAKWQQTVVFKYGYTAASDGKRTIVAEDAPVSLATAGSGDVLAGMIGGFLAQGLAPLDAAALALYVGPRAARRVEQRFGTLGLVAGDLPDAIAEELAALEAGKRAHHA